MSKRILKITKNKLISITRIIFLTTQIFAILWVTWSYGIATYSTIMLLQPFPVTELSETAIKVLLGNGALKVVENIFEHNNGKVLGESQEYQE